MFRDLLPPRVRKIIYSTIAAVTAIEGAFDGVGWGLIPNDIQSKALFVAATLGLSLAAGNTNIRPPAP